MTNRCIQCLQGFIIIVYSTREEHKQGSAVLLSLADTDTDELYERMW
jgi:hypothetical protein